MVPLKRSHAFSEEYSMNMRSFKKSKTSKQQLVGGDEVSPVLHHRQQQQHQQQELHDR